jgi:hypothetical protein
MKESLELKFLRYNPEQDDSTRCCKTTRREERASKEIGKIVGRNERQKTLSIDLYKMEIVLGGDVFGPYYIDRFWRRY